MLFTFTGFTTFYELYVGLLKATIAAAVAMSVLVSLDRLYKVVAFLGVSISQWRTGEALPLCHNINALIFQNPWTLSQLLIESLLAFMVDSKRIRSPPHSPPTSSDTNLLFVCRQGTRE